MVTDPFREAELIAEFQRRVRYLADAYQLEMSLGLDRRSFNASLARLKASAGRPIDSRVRQSRLSPWLEVAINIEVRALAGYPADAPLSAEDGPHVRQAAINVVARAKPIRVGRDG